MLILERSYVNYKSVNVHLNRLNDFILNDHMNQVDNYKIVTNIYRKSYNNNLNKNVIYIITHFFVTLQFEHLIIHEQKAVPNDYFNNFNADKVLVVND